MPSYFYIDKNGTKQDPINDQQLQALITQRIITPQTSLETESGYKGLAGQIPGLNFPSAVPPSVSASNKSPLGQSLPMVTQVAGKISILAWLLDFAFRDIRLLVINLWFCRIVYAICCVFAILDLLLGTLGILGFSLYNSANEPTLIFMGIGAVLFLWIITPILIIVIRLSLEWEIILFDWIIMTTKASRRFLNEDKT